MHRISRTAGPVVAGACLAVAAAWSLLSGAGVDRSIPGSRGGPDAPGGAGAPLGWSPRTLEAAVPAGGHSTYEIRFVASVALTGVRLTVVPELAPYVGLSPDAFASIAPGAPVTVRVLITVPEGTPPATVGGVIRLLRGPRTVARPLSVVLEILEPTCDARALLFSRNVAGADDCLQAALSRNPADQEANFLRAVTRVLRVVEDRGPGPDPSAITDSLQEMLDQFGALTESRDPFGFRADFPSPLPADSPTGGDIQEFLRRVVIPELDGAIDDNLRHVGPSFSFVVTPEELAGIGLIQSGPVEIDHGDAGILTAGLGILRGFLMNFLLAHDLNIDVDDWRLMPPDRFQQDVLDRYPNLLDLAPDGAAILGRAKASYIAAADSYFSASHFIRNLDDFDQFDDLFAIAAEDGAAEERLRRRLGIGRCALLGQSFVRVTDAGAECAPGVPVFDSTPTNPAPFFDDPVGLRGLLPPLSSDPECAREFVDTSAPTPTFPFPDPTANGVFPSMTQDELIRRLEFTPRLGFFPNAFFMEAPIGGLASSFAVLSSESRRFAPVLRLRSVRLARGTAFSVADLPPISPDQPRPLCKPSGGQVFFRLEFSPPGSGPFTDTLIVESNDPQSPRRIKVFGCGGPLPIADCDRDGIYDWYDNCAGTFNPTQADSDSDGVGNLCDGCPTVADADQVDADGDGRGDACDTCPLDPSNDADGDGLCGGVDRCPLDPQDDADGDGWCADVDNCPAVANPDQVDTDGDRRGDACDTCLLNPAPDPDGDGLCGADDPCPLDPANDSDGDGRCADADNCPLAANPDQADSDGDGLGDACDGDADNDGIPNDVDNCPRLGNPDQADADADGVGNACDNCPDAVNHDQADRNADGAGDACQPSVEILDFQSPGDGTLVVTVRLQDPNGDPVHGGVNIPDFPVHLDDFIVAPYCDVPLLPESLPGQGLAFGLIEGTGLLFDADRGAAELFGITCQDGLQDYEIALGSCATAGQAYFNYLLVLSDPVSPRAICVRRVDGSAVFDLRAMTDPEGQFLIQSLGAATPYANTTLPQSIILSRLTPLRAYELEITATDGKTPVVKDVKVFFYSGQTSMVFIQP